MLANQLYNYVITFYCKISLGTLNNGLVITGFVPGSFIWLPHILLAQCCFTSVFLLPTIH